VSAWDVFDRMVEEEAKRLAKQTAEGVEEMTESEKEKLVKVYVDAHNSLVEVGRFTRDARGFVVSDDALADAARFTIIAFDALIKLAAAGVRAGLDERAALVFAATYLFNEPLLASIAVVNKTIQYLPESVKKDMAKRLEKKEKEERKRRKGNPLE